MQDMPAVVELVRKGTRFLLTCHVLPDPDAMGSMLGLAAVLRALGKDVYLYNRDPVPESLCFLDGADEVQAAIPGDVRFDGTFITDTAARTLLPSSLPAPPVTGPIVMVDHHYSHDDFGDLILRDPDAPATAVVVQRLAAALGVDPVPAPAAAPLYTALVADTGGFRYSSTSAATLRLAADLLDLGVEPWTVASHVFEHWPMERMRLLGYAINAIETEQAGRIAVLSVPLSMLEQAGATEQMVEGLVEYGRMLRGVEIAIALWERRARKGDVAPAGSLLTRVSMRSAGRADVSRVAAAVGGGGHRTAAGATLGLGLDDTRRRVLLEATRELSTLA